MIRAVLGAGVLAAIGPFALLLSQWPVRDLRAEGRGLDMSVRAASPEAAPLERWRAPDGALLGLRRYASARPGAPLMVMVHGSGWHGLQFDTLARRLSQAGLADVLVPDLRGHGPDPVRRGDVRYIGQLEDDLAALIGTEAASGQRVILLGHSSGGGLVVRMAGGHHGALMDGAVLLAPYLGHNAPTTRPGSGGWARPLVRRIIALSVLNRLGITALNGLTVTQLRFPQAVLDGPLGATATRDYSYRLTVSYAPRADLAGDVATLPSYLLIAGGADEAFRARAYQPLLAAMNPHGRYRLVPGVGHLGVVDAEVTFQALTGWLAGS